MKNSKPSLRAKRSNPVKKIILVLFLIIIAIGAYFVLANPKDPATDSNKPTIKIGVVFPLSGDYAILGQPIKGAVEVALKDANRNNNKYNYVAIFEDNTLSTTKSSTLANKLISVDKVDALITFASNVGNVVSPIADKNKTIHLSISSDTNVANGKYNFINWTMPDKEAKKLLDIVVAKEYKNVAIIAANNDGTLAMAEAFEKQLPKNINRNTLKINFGTRDMRLDIKKMQNKGTDLYFVLLGDPELSLFIKQLRELGDASDITAIEAFSFLNDLSIVEGYWYVDAGYKYNDKIKEIQEHNNSEATYAVSNVYDNVMLIVNAFEKSDVKEDAIDALLNVKKYTGIGFEIEQDENGIFHSEPVIKKVINGKPTIVE